MRRVPVAKALTEQPHRPAPPGSTESQGGCATCSAQASPHRMVNYRRWLPASLALAGGSLLCLPSGLGYDPWSWMVWGRELDHGTIITAGAASSIKPLPIGVDVLLAPFGGAAGDLWLVFARAGIIMSVVLVYHLGRALAGRAAGITAAAGWLTAYQVAGYLALEGMSEPLCAAFVLAAWDAHLAGRRWRAFALGFLASLVRVELLAFLALYGALALLRRAPRRRLAAVTVAALLAVVPLAWLLPDAVGSGDVFRSAVRATYESQGGPLLSTVPGLAALSEAWRTLIWPLVVAFGVDSLASLFAWVKYRRLRPTVWLACGAWGLLGLEAVMVQLHLDTGAPRYLLPGVALAAVVAGCAWAGALQILPRLLPKARPGLLLAVAWVVLWAAPANALVERAQQEQHDWAAAKSVQHLANELPRAVSRLGGRAAVLACGTIAAAPLQNPVVAWELDVPLGHVGISPSAHGVVFGAGGEPQVPARYAGKYRTVGTVGSPPYRWTALTTCPPPER